MVQQPRDVLAPGPARPAAPAVPVVDGMWLEHRGSGFVGVVVHSDRRSVTLRDDSDLQRVFPLTERGYRLLPADQVVTLVPPAPAQSAAPRRTASGALAGPARPAKVARADRLLVEGVHDAELLEKVWGDDLRDAAVVVEPIGGVDHLADEIAARRPGPGRRLGILLDHMVPGSKETRVATAVAGPHVLVDGHEFVDVWQAVRPHVVGLRAWPHVPMGQEWKEGICRSLGFDDPRLLWRRILRAVGDYRDLEPSLVGAVERLLDFLLAGEE